MAEPLDEAALIAKVRSLPPDRQEQLLAFVDFLVAQEAHHGDDAAARDASEARARKIRAGLDAALRNGPPAAEAAPEDEGQQKALEELARRFPPDGAEGAF